MKQWTGTYTSAGNADLTFLDKTLSLGGSTACSIKFASQGLSAFVHIQWSSSSILPRKDCNV
jgi:hypothetical protein